MKYFGEPNLTVIDYEECKKVFQFDEKGEYETEDEKIIKWMKENKWFIKHEEENNAKSDKKKLNKGTKKSDNKEPKKRTRK